MSKFSFLRRHVHFIQKHWFSIAIVCMLLLALVKQKTAGQYDSNNKAPNLFPKHTEATGNSGMAQEQPQKSVLGIFSEESGKRIMPAVSSGKATRFFKRFQGVALAEEQKYGVPAAAILATAYVNSFAGTRNCTVHANNYFALSCTAVSGMRYDEHGRCKTKLNTPWEGFRTFSRYLEIQPWFAEAQQSAGTNALLWIDIFEKMQLSDVEDFSVLAKQAISEYQLQALPLP